MAWLVYSGDFWKQSTLDFQGTRKLQYGILGKWLAATIPNTLLPVAYRSFSRRFQQKVNKTVKPQDWAGYSTSWWSESYTSMGTNTIFEKFPNALLRMIEITVGDADTELGFIASIRTMGLYNSRAHVVLLNRQRQDGWNYCEGKAKPKWQPGILTCKDLWLQLTDHSIPRSRIGV